MKKHSKKTLLGILGIGTGVVLLSGCTANFCSETDKASMLYPYERGVTVYADQAGVDKFFADTYAEEAATMKTLYESRGLTGLAFPGKNTNIYYYVPWKINDKDYVEFTSKTATSGIVNSTISTAFTNGYSLPSAKYWASMDKFALDLSVSSCYENNKGSYASLDAFVADIKITGDVNVLTSDGWYLNPYVEFDCVGGDGTNAIKNSILRDYGFLRYTTEGKDELFGCMDAWYKELVDSTDPLLGPSGCPTVDLYSTYKTNLNSKIANNRACSTISGGLYGHYGPSADWTVYLSKKDWSYAWSKGFLEGLLVYPVSWMVDTFAVNMDPALSGTGQIWALIFVTLIVRALLVAATFKSTMDGQKMQALQPQLAKIQAKYPNSNTNQAEKARMAQEQSALYKRNKINPLSQILMLIIQFPVFICVWSGLQGSAALSTGQFLNLNLSDTIQATLFNFKGTWYLNTTGWWTALILFILMAGTQVMAMLLPKIFQKKANAKIAKMGKNPAQASQGKTMKWVTIIMMGFTIVMGFFLPSAMGVYWLIGGIIGMIQTTITQLIMAKNAKKKGNI